MPNQQNNNQLPDVSNGTAPREIQTRISSTQELPKGSVLIGETVYLESRTFNVRRFLKDYLLDAFRY